MKLQHHICTLLILTVGIDANAQQDSIPKNNRLEEVVVTGQYNPQSVKKSVFQVTVISREDIDRQAGNNLADLLNQTLNINIIPDASTSKSGVKLFGLGGDYFKILVDNIPVINDEGLGSNTDLTQINLDDIQQIEIVEGSMGVEYGADAVSGIINIITKKSSAYKWEITPYIQEETISNEYNVSDEGRHIQSLKIGHNFNSKFYANAMVTSNDFKGFYNDKQGAHYLENDGLRGYEWLPKNQLTAKSLLSYSLKNHRIFYKFEYFSEDVKQIVSEVTPNYDAPTETTNPTANDKTFSTTRFFHNLNASGRFENGMNYDVSVSYQEQERNVEAYSYRIRSDEKFMVQHYEYESRDGFYSKGNFANFLKNETVDFQVGYELSGIKGYSQAVPGQFGTGAEARSLNSYDVFASAEINLGKRISLRPGARLLFSSLFDRQTALSFSAKYAFDNGYELRAIVGTAPKLPTYDELYTYFVDVNHNVQGNQNLNPEQGNSVFLHLNKIFTTANNVGIKSKFSMWFMDVKDRIELIVISQTPQAYQFNNIDLFRTWGTSLTTTIDYNNLVLNAGITFFGVSKVLDSDKNTSDDYLYSAQVNGNASYRVPKWKTVFSLFGKYTGPEYQFVTVSDANGNEIYAKGKQNDYTFIDATIKKSLLSDKLEITAGARNL
ncbi:MAG TPA: TonB-dependent receptor plug domain-containing protein, partial [Flavobacterium sp.]|nr:TonB-dependent receptor plug domain-containing protein [Flavobacterium sp.]